MEPATASPHTEDRRPEIDSRKCTKCNECIRLCPQGAVIEPSNALCAKCIKFCLSMEVPCEVKRPAIVYQSCDGCGRCVTGCPQKAISWMSEKAQATPAQPVPGS
ncbi:MAG: 4Fe-4S binding protein [Deltaproteobacteria bacterium]|nr:4Fe-4S binding protein [Deltaproteobacteria bacterium]